VKVKINLSHYGLTFRLFFNEIWPFSSKSLLQSYLMEKKRYLNKFCADIQVFLWSFSCHIKSTPTDFNCVKLLPRNMKDPSFISFKIGMPEELFKGSLNPTLWSSGSAIREFIDRFPCRRRSI
jgi:hypothetical protein